MSNDQAHAGSETQRRRGLDGRVIAGRYHITRTVAAGANTLIADALDTDLDRQVTIKLVRPELSESEAFRRHIRQQMEAVSAVAHPNLAAIYDWGEERIGKRTTVFVVGEYLSGGNLRDLFDRKRRLSPSQALMVGLEACRGLDFANRHGLVHTELTPSKLVFGDDRRLRIVDFGLARTLGEQVWRDPSRVPTHVARYASPEQALAVANADESAAIDGRTDVYSLALILVEAVTGTLPFQGDSTVATLTARIGRLMPVSADLGPLAAVLERAGRPDPADRATAAQFGRDLVRAAERMPRPKPIPILASTLHEDPAALRRPNDPTGGIARPPAEPEPALVPPAAPGAPTADEEEPATHDTAVVPTPVEAPTETSTDAAAQRAGDATESDVADAASMAAPTTDDASESTEFVDLAALVESTPPPTPPSDDVPATAVRGRKGRKAARTEQKAAQKAARSAKDDDAVARRTAPAGAVSADAGKPRHRVLSFLFGLVLVAILAGLGVVAWKLFRTPTHEVPAVAGLSQDEALGLVDDFNWEIDVEPTRSDEYDTPGQVVRTAPDAGDDLAEGSPLIVFVSEGPEFRQIPNVAGQTLEEATASLDDARLVVGATSEEYDPAVPAGAVVSYGIDGPLTEQGVLPGTPVNLVLSQGPAPIAMPNLVGRTPEQAQRLLEQFGLVLVVGDPVFSNDVDSGLVAAQDPAADSQITPGSSVTVNASKGPDLVPMPDLTGLVVPQIREALTNAGLTPGYLLGSTQGTFVQATVDGEDVAAGTPLLRGSTVDFFAVPAG